MIMRLKCHVTLGVTFQRCFNVVFWLMRRRDVGQHQINVETTLCISTLEFSTSNNVESVLCISTLIWTTLVNVETMLWKWPFLKKTKQIRSFNYSFTAFFNLLPMLIEYVEEYLQCRENFLNFKKDTALLELNLNCFTL